MQVEQFEHNPDVKFLQTEESLDLGQEAQDTAQSAEQQVSDIQAVQVELQAAESPVATQAAELGQEIQDAGQMIELAEIQVGDKSSLFEIYINDENGSNFRLNNLEDYQPKTTTQLVPIPDDIAQFITPERGLSYNAFLENVAFPMIGGNNEQINLENSDKDETQQWLVDYLTQNPDLLKQQGIDDLQNVSPRQAISLIQQVVIDSLEYDKEQSDSLHFLKHDNDKDSIAELLTEGDGICRNYASAVYGLFEALKDLQDPETTQLLNTYCTQASNTDNNTQVRKSSNVTSGHIWNNFYTIGPDGSIDMSAIDTTLSDSGSQMDTETFMLLEIDDLVQNDLLATNLASRFLLSWLKKEENQDSKIYTHVLKNAEIYARRKDDQYVPGELEILQDARAKNMSERIANGESLSNQESEIYAMHVYEEDGAEAFIKIDQASPFPRTPVNCFLILSARLETDGEPHQKMYDYAMSEALFLQKRFPTEFRALEKAY